jgi:hypothetical protein
MRINEAGLDEALGHGAFRAAGISAASLFAARAA